MEKATFHEHLTRLREVFPDCETISIPQAAKFYGCHPNSLRRSKTFPARQMGRYARVTLINFARWLAE